MDELINTPELPQEEAEIQQEPAQVEVVDIQFREGQKIYFFDPCGMKLNTGDHLIIDTARGLEYGICTGGNHQISEKDVIAPLRRVVRVATAQDEKTVEDNRQKEKRAESICAQKIAEHGLDMQLVSAEYAFDCSKILFFFTADERVDFRELVKNLAGIFHTRIELRQIGVRDKAKMVGGLGICGRPFCCSQFLEDFQPVSIKMAKTQNLSLNPTKISGTCGRLMCCLKYEQEAYEDLIRHSPKPESFVDTPDGRGTVVDVNLLRQSVKVRMEKNPETCTVFKNEDIYVLRSGKAKKTDPPIPDDLAPISGPDAKPRRRTEEEEQDLLEPVKFRYRMDAVVEEQSSDETEQAEKGETPDTQNRRRRRPRNPQKREEDQPRSDRPRPPRKPRGDGKSHSEGVAKAQGDTKPQEKQDRPPREGSEKKSPRRNFNHHHRRKPRTPGEESKDV